MRAFFEDESVLAFFTDRHGGFSKSPFDSLNVSHNVGDNVSDVVKNRQLIADKEGFLLENLVYMKQVHSNSIEVVKNSFLSEIKDTDGLITDRRKIPLMAMSADCAAVLLYDKRKKLIAALHSGREGAFKNIVKSAIISLKENFGSKPEDIYAHIGPSIGVCCYEIGEDLAHLNREKFGEGYIVEKNGKYYLDIKKMLKEQLLKEGVKPEHLKISDICTSCDKNYFSYRRDGQTGRFCGVIMLK